MDAMTGTPSARALRTASAMTADATADPPGLLILSTMASTPASTASAIAWAVVRALATVVSSGVMPSPSLIRIAPTA